MATFKQVEKQVNEQLVSISNETGEGKLTLNIIRKGLETDTVDSIVNDVVTGNCTTKEATSALLTTYYICN